MFGSPYRRLPVVMMHGAAPDTSQKIPDSTTFRAVCVQERETARKRERAKQNERKLMNTCETVREKRMRRSETSMARDLSFAVLSRPRCTQLLSPSTIAVFSVFHVRFCLLAARSTSSNRKQTSFSTSALRETNLGGAAVAGGEGRGIGRRVARAHASAATLRAAHVQRRRLHPFQPIAAHGSWNRKTKNEKQKPERKEQDDEPERTRTDVGVPPSSRIWSGWVG